MWGLLELPRFGDTQAVTTIGIAKSVFQIHGIDAAEKVVVRKQRRASARCSGHASNDARFVSLILAS